MANGDLVLMLDPQQVKVLRPAALVFGGHAHVAPLHGESEADTNILHCHLDKPAQAGCFMEAEFAPVDGYARVHGHSVRAAPIRRSS